MDFAYSKTFIITNDLKAIVSNWQLDAAIFIEKKNKNTGLLTFIMMDLNHWTEFKKTINAIDEEFKRRFNYQHPNP